MTQLTGRTALVTGGSRGIGRAVALRLAADGAAVALTYASSRAAADDVVATITEKGATALALPCDITDVAATRAVFDTVLERFGHLDIVVNNAGVGATGPVTATTEEEYDRLFAVTRGTFFALREAAARVRDGGRIISLSTGLTRTWPAMTGAYAGSKAAVEQFTRALSKEIGARGITVNAVLPGVVDTDMIAHAPEAFRERGRQMSSLGRLGTPEDIADVIAFLAGPDSRWITGQLLLANGGTVPS